MSRCSAVLSNLVLSTIGLVALAGCGGVPGGAGGGAGGDAPTSKLPGILDAKALSQHYVEVTFTESVGSKAATAGSYKITSADSSSLPVYEARISPDGTQVILTTDGQRDVIYILETADADPIGDGTESGGTLFAGSTASEPILQSAISLDENTVLLTFSEGMDQAAAETAAYYAIDDPELNVTAADLDADDSRVLLTTSTQQNTEYTVKVTNVIGDSGGKLIDPTRNTATFYGIPADDNVQPYVAGAAATASTSVLLSFSEPLADGADDPVNFTVTPTGGGDDVPNGEDANVDGDDDPNGEDDDDDGDGKSNDQDDDVDGDGEPNGEDDDVDGDGVPNAEDDDVDGDGQPNGEDNDVDGDGKSNGRDSDVDGDGQPNGQDDDVDGDGKSNEQDDDIDGDGKPNGQDDDVDGDGKSNAVDDDVDGDGVPNAEDDDADADGEPDAAVGDVDGDGVPDDEDSDIDGDGIPNDQDSDSDGDGEPDD